MNDSNNPENVSPQKPVKDSRDEVELYKAHPSMFRNHPFLYLLTVATPILGLILTFYLMWQGQPAWQVLSVFIILCCGGVAVFLIWWLKSVSTTLTVTNLRTTLWKGLLSRNITEVWHQDVRNVQIHQTFWQRIFGVGELGISSAAQSEIEIDVKGVPHPDKIKDLIDEHRKR